jgi:hypothetical protein
MGTGHKASSCAITKNKFVAWTNLINTIIQRGTTVAKEVESIIG